MRSNLYKSDIKEPFNVSRSKIAFFLECPQCFWLDRKLGITRPDVPFSHPSFHIWRDDHNMKVGASFLHKKTNLNICGIIDDIWINNKTNELHIVDYKSTSTDYPISLDSKYKEEYKKQMEIYQWIFLQMGFSVSKTGYFLFANGNKNLPGFHGKLEFETSIISYPGDTSWIEPVILEIKKCLDSDDIPESAKSCQYCSYRKLIQSQSLKNQIILI